MGKNCEEKSIKKVLNLALVFQLLYLFSISLLNLLSKWNAIPKPMMNVFQSHNTFVPVVDYLNIVIVLCSTIFFIGIYMFIKKKINNNCRLTAIHTISIIIFIVIFHNVIPFFSGHWSIEYLASTISGVQPLISISTVVGLEGWMSIWRFVAIVLLLCSYAMYWYKSNLSSTITEAININAEEVTHH